MFAGVGGCVVGGWVAQQCQTHLTNTFAVCWLTGLNGWLRFFSLLLATLNRQPKTILKLIKTIFFFVLKFEVNFVFGLRWQKPWEKLSHENYNGGQTFGWPPNWTWTWNCRQFCWKALQSSWVQFEIAKRLRKYLAENKFRLNKRSEGEN